MKKLITALAVWLPLVTFAQTFPVQNLTVLGTTQSTSPTSGSAVFAGGVGITGNINVGGNAVLTGSLTVPTLSVTNVNPSLLFQYSGTGSVARSYQSKFQDSITPTDCGAAGNGIADDTTAVTACDAIASSAGLPLTIDRTYLVSGSPTLSSNLKYGGGRIKWASGTLTANGRVDAPDNAGIFDYPATAHLTLTSALNSRVSVGWLYGLRDGSLDVSRFMNDAISSAPSGGAAPIGGREIYIPMGNWRLKAETVQIGMQNYITIDGQSSGERSGVEYFKSPPVGIGGQTEFPGGGSNLIVDKSLTLGITLAPYSSPYTTYRVTGLTFKHFHMSGSNNSLVSTGGAGPQSGIWIQGANDGLVIDDIVMVSFSGTALEVDNMDAADIGNSWIAENTNCVYLGVSGIRSRIHNLALGANTSQFNNSYGTALHLTGTTLSTFSNISIFGGAQAIVLDGGSNFNTFSSWRIDNNFTGQIVIVSGSENVFSGGGIYINPNGTADPLGRDHLYGVIQLQAGDSNQFIGIDQNTQFTAPYDDIRINGGRNTVIVGGTHWGPTSTEAIHVQNYATVGSITMVKAAPYGQTAIDTPVPVVDATYVDNVAPTISSGFGTSPSITSGTGATAFTINVGSGGTASSGVISLPKTTQGWYCTAQDLTTVSSSVFSTKETAQTTTSVTLTNFNTSGAAAAWAANDVLAVSCIGY